MSDTSTRVPLNKIVNQLYPTTRRAIKCWNFDSRSKLCLETKELLAGSKKKLNAACLRLQNQSGHPRQGRTSERNINK